MMGIFFKFHISNYWTNIVYTLTCQLSNIYTHKKMVLYILKEINSLVASLFWTMQSAPINWDANQIFPQHIPLFTSLHSHTHTHSKQEQRQIRDEVQIRVGGCMCGGSDGPWWSWDDKSSKLQPTAAEPMRVGDHVGRQPYHGLLRQDKGAEAMPLPVHEEPQSSEIHQLTWCKEGGHHLWHTFPQMLNSASSITITFLSHVSIAHYLNIYMLHLHLIYLSV